MRMNSVPGEWHPLPTRPIMENFGKIVSNLMSTISIHAPYYISLTSEKPETVQSSIGRVANVYAWAVWLNAKRIVLHPGTYGSEEKTHGELIKMIVDGVKQGIELSYEKYPEMKDQFQQICLCAETMGKFGQLGPTEEVIQICKDLGTDICRPCIDFGHLYARNLGKNQDRAFYEKNLNLVESELGKEVVQNLHIHYSHVEFTENGGEKDHVENTNKTFGPDIHPLFEIIRENSFTPIIINESPELEPDAKILMDLWKSMQNTKSDAKLVERLKGKKSKSKKD